MKVKSKMKTAMAVAAVAALGAFAPAMASAEQWRLQRSHRWWCSRRGGDRQRIAFVVVELGRGDYDDLQRPDDRQSLQPGRRCGRPGDELWRRVSHDELHGGRGLQLPGDERCRGELPVGGHYGGHQRHDLWHLVLHDARADQPGQPLRAGGQSKRDRQHHGHRDELAVPVEIHERGRLDVQPRLVWVDGERQSQSRRDRWSDDHVVVASSGAERRGVLPAVPWVTVTAIARSRAADPLNAGERCPLTGPASEHDSALHPCRGMAAQTRGRPPEHRVPGKRAHDGRSLDPRRTSRRLA